MDLAVALIKSVMRAFYPTRDILVVDALILHETYVPFSRRQPSANAR